MPNSASSSILIHAKTDFDKKFEQVKELLSEEKFVELTLHGLESGINKTVELVLRLQLLFHKNIEIEMSSSSVDLIDGLSVIAKEIEPEGLKRTCAVLHVVIRNTTKF